LKDTPSKLEIVNKTADYTITATDFCKIFTNRHERFGIDKTPFSSKRNDSCHAKVCILSSAYNAVVYIK